MWAIVQEFPQYQISKKGKMRRTSSHKKVASNNTNNRYILVGLCNNGIKITRQLHRLLAKAFVPNPENKPHVNHKDGNKHNNNISNLEWCTHAENSAHASRMGLMKSFWKGKYGKDIPKSRPIRLTFRLIF